MVGSHLRLYIVALTLLCASLSASQSRAAETIEFPKEELAAESVLPVFDNPVSVKNKRVLTAQRWEIGPTAGLSLLEPFFSTLSYGATLGYHMKEETGINVFGVMFAQGISSNAQGLNPVPGTTTNVNLQYAPAPKYLLLANYQYTGFYGKISITKDYVMNLSLFGTLGAGLFGVGDSVNPALNLGIGQKLYFSPNWALRLDFRMIPYYGPDVLSYDLRNQTSEQSASAFGKKLLIPTMLSASLVFLFPGI